MLTASKENGSLCTIAFFQKSEFDPLLISSSITKFCDKENREVECVYVSIQPVLPSRWSKPVNPPAGQPGQLGRGSLGQLSIGVITAPANGRIFARDLCRHLWHIIGILEWK